MYFSEGIMDPFCYSCFMFIFVMLSCAFLVIICMTSWLSCVLSFLVFLSLSHMVFRVGCGT